MSKKKFTYSQENVPEIWSGDHKMTPFLNLLTSTWDKLHDETNVFRYKVGNIEQRMLDNKYVLTLNPDRGFNRRPPESITSLHQEFNPQKFNFTKVADEEIIMELHYVKNDETTVHKILVNASPISRYHSLLCPSLDACLPQIADAANIQVVLQVMFLAQHCDFRVGFNSLCGWASVNHLHYHLFMESHNLCVENVKCHKVIGEIYHTDLKYEVPGFCFQVKHKADIYERSPQIGLVLDYFLEKSIAYNILCTRGRRFDGNGEVIRVFVWPRQPAHGVKNYSNESLNAGFCELSGWIPVFKKDDYENMQSKNIENELSKWKYDIESFVVMCEEVKGRFK